MRIVTGTTSESELISCHATVKPNCNLVWHGRSTTSELGLSPFNVFKIKLFTIYRFWKPDMYRLHFPENIHTHPTRKVYGTSKGGMGTNPKFLKENMLVNRDFQGARCSNLKNGYFLEQHISLNFPSSVGLVIFIQLKMYKLFHYKYYSYSVHYNIWILTSYQMFAFFLYIFQSTITRQYPVIYEVKLGNFFLSLV